MRAIKNFGLFWLDFILGNDWVMSVTLLISLAVVTSLSHDHTNAWYFLPIVVVLALSLSVFKAMKPPTNRYDWRMLALLIVVSTILLLQLIPVTHNLLFSNPNTRTSQQPLNPSDPDGL